MLRGIHDQQGNKTDRSELRDWVRTKDLSRDGSSCFVRGKMSFPLCPGSRTLLRQRRSINLGLDFPKHLENHDWDGRHQPIHSISESHSDDRCNIERTDEGKVL